jgi:hypothetical protein
MTADHAGNPHQSRDPSLPTPGGPDTQLDLGPQGRIHLRPGRWLATATGVVPAGGDTQHPAQQGDRMMYLLVLNQFECPVRRESVSWANKAAAFFRISFPQPGASLGQGDGLGLEVRGIGWFGSLHQDLLAGHLRCPSPQMTPEPGSLHRRRAFTWVLTWVDEPRMCGRSVARAVDCTSIPTQLGGVGR